MKRVIWSLKKKEERRFRQGHPWVFGNELGQVDELIQVGGEVELRDSHGNFLALGYGNRKSLISFRAWSRSSEDREKNAFDLIVSRLQAAMLYRSRSKFSCRVVFGEADALPGFVMDRYLTNQGVVYVAQVTTAGAESLILPNLLEAMKALDWIKDDTSVLLDQTARIRELEGLEVKEEKSYLLKSGKVTDLQSAWVQLNEKIKLKVDLIHGQKTGLFLDQQDTIERMMELISKRSWDKSKTIRILDVCSYVGAWGVQLASAFKALGYSVEWTALDASEKALAFARENADANEIDFVPVCQDVMEPWSVEGAFDLIVVDPPALIKSKKHHSQGKRAYQALNKKALSVLENGGWMVSCSCSFHLSEWELREALSVAEMETGRSMRWFARGSQSYDHPLRSTFPEGLYLKSWIGELDANL